MQPTAFHPRFSRRRFVAMLDILAIPAPIALATSATRVMVYRDPGCGGCGKWIDHLRRNGFEVESRNTSELGVIRARLGVPAELSSCHTAVVGGHVVEGHVPAQDIQRLLREKPAVKGLALPGMPAGSPGMESPRPIRYATFLFDTGGRHRIFEQH